MSDESKTTPTTFGRSLSVPRFTLGDRSVSAAFILVGAVALYGSTQLSDAREVLIALAGVGAFAAILSLAVNDEPVVLMSVGQTLSETLVRNESAIVSALGFKGAPHYVPLSSDSRIVRLYIGETPEANVPTDDRLQNTLVSDGEVSGLVLDPAGDQLVKQYVMLNGPLPETAEATAEVIAEIVTAQFELADSISYEQSRPGELTVTINGSIFSDTEGPDGVIKSAFGVGLAQALETPISAERIGEDANRYVFDWTPLDGE